MGCFYTVLWYYRDVGKPHQTSLFGYTNIMVTAQNILYSVSAARRILGIYYPEIKVRIQVWKTVVWVYSEGRRPSFISKSVFKNHFAQWRKQQAKGLKVWEESWMPGGYNVFNPKKGTSYLVIVKSDRVSCNCNDYTNQIEFFGKGCCKHGYATLDYLGFSTLADYLTAQKQPVAA
jgi:hypothetical protein